MPRKRILITVTTYPLPSRSYDELVCTAGLLEDGTWIRLYPMPLSFMKKLKDDGMVTARKYTWIELNVTKRADDFRPESHKPEDYDFKDFVIQEHLDTTKNWFLRKQICLKNVYTDLAKLIADSRAPLNTSLVHHSPSITTL